MHRICVPPALLAQPTLILPEAVAHYVTHVLRLQVGATLTAFDGSGQECLLRLTSVTGTTVEGTRLAFLPPTPQPETTVILGQGFPKGAKLDVIIEKCAEVGLTTLVPLYTVRTVVREAPERLSGKMARWQRLAAAAARQCGRRTVLDVHAPLSFADFCQRYASAPCKVLCWEEEVHLGLRQVLAHATGQSPLVVMVGPEGGFTTAEVELARAYGFVAVSLGPYHLRTETAAIVLAGIIRYSLGDLEPAKDPAERREAP